MVLCYSHAPENNISIKIAVINFHIILLEPPLDFSTFRKQLENELTRDITSFSKSHANEDIYAFSLDCNIYESEITLSANTTKYLKEKATEYRKDEIYHNTGQQELETELRWATGDWEYMEIMTGYGDIDTWTEIEENINDVIVEAFMCMMCELVISIESDGLLLTLWPDKNIDFICIEHDESISAAQNRLNLKKSVKHIK